MFDFGGANIGLVRVVFYLQINLLVGLGVGNAKSFR